MSELPIYQPDPAADDWILVEDYHVTAGGRTWVVPAGMRSDMASIPRFAWSIVGPPNTPRIEPAATLHDYLYLCGPSLGVDREQADKLFLVLCRRYQSEKPLLKYIALRMARASRYVADGDAPHPATIDLGKASLLAPPSRPSGRGGIFCLTGCIWCA